MEGADAKRKARERLIASIVKSTTEALEPRFVAIEAKLDRLLAELGVKVA